MFYGAAFLERALFGRNEGTLPCHFAQVELEEEGVTFFSGTKKGTVFLFLFFLSNAVIFISFLRDKI